MPYPNDSEGNNRLKGFAIETDNFSSEISSSGRKFCFYYGFIFQVFISLFVVFVVIVCMWNGFTTLGQLSIAQNLSMGAVATSSNGSTDVTTQQVNAAIETATICVGTSQISVTANNVIVVGVVYFILGAFFVFVLYKFNAIKIK